jgi:hypothetical protein
VGGGDRGGVTNLASEGLSQPSRVNLTTSVFGLYGALSKHSQTYRWRRLRLKTDGCNRIFTLSLEGLTIGIGV